jgi:hypothetical protein
MTPAELSANYVSPFSVRDGGRVRTCTQTELIAMARYEDEAALEQYQRTGCCGNRSAMGRCRSTLVRLRRAAELSDAGLPNFQECEVCPKLCQTSPAGALL